MNVFDPGWRAATIAICVSCGTVPAAPAAKVTPAGAPTTIDVFTDAGNITSIDLSPFTLIPAFSPTTYDYYVRCAEADNVATITVTDAHGLQSTGVDLLEDQALVVGASYWIRCLPHDFPAITVAAHVTYGVPTPGYYLVNSATYAAVLDTNGTPVWYARGVDVVNADSQEPNVITLVPNGTAPYGWDSATHFDIHALATQSTTGLYASQSPTDAHELRVLPNGDYMLLTYPIRTHVDLTGLGAFGDDETMADCEIQELDAQGSLVWSWDGSDHVDPVRESIEPVTNPVNGASVVDPFHCNSIDVDGNGNLLVSFRHANAIFYVDRGSGAVEWKLGGATYNKDGATYIAVASDPEGAFSMQHDARFTATGEVTMFDDHGGVPTGYARGVEYSLDHETNSASVVFQFLGTAQSEYEGSFRRYADGHSVISWGFIPTDPRVITEIDAAGNDVLDVSFSGGSYRGVKVPLAQLDIGLLRASTAR